MDYNDNETQIAGDSYRTEYSETYRVEGSSGEADTSDKKGKGGMKFAAGLIVGLVAGICGCAVVVIIALLIMYSSDTFRLNYKATEKLKLIETMIRDHYLHEDQITQDTLEDGMYKGMMDSLGDPYSVYLNSEDFKSMMDTTRGSFGGVGMNLTQDEDTKQIKVYKVISDSPAERAGIQDDDILLKVDGEDISKQELDSVVLKVRGEKGSKVHLDFKRGEEEIAFDVVRDIINIETVEWRMEDEDNKIGYIYISEFDEVTYDQFMKALYDLQDQGMKSMILDLRENPGGNVDTVCDIADELLPEGKIVYVVDKEGHTKNYNSDAHQSYKGPMVVLVDQYSASASEILTGALKDYDLATIVGKKTYGKGIVQSIYPLGDGSALKITVEDYYSPNGHNIHGVGIEPDVDVELDVDKYKEDKTDTQLDAAKKELIPGKG